MTYKPFGVETPVKQAVTPPAPEPAPPPPPPPSVPPPSAPEPLPVPALPARKGKPKVVSVKARATGAKAVDLLVLSGVDRTFAAGLIDWLLQETCGKVVKTVAAAPEEEDSDLDVLLRRYRKLHRHTTTINPTMLDQDFAAAKKLLARHGLDVVTRQMEALSAIEDEFVRKQGFTFTVLQRHWSRLAAAGRTAEKIARRDAPAGCQHTPPCQTAEEHTRRYLRDLNGSPSPARTSRAPTTSKPSGPSSAR